MLGVHEALGTDVAKRKSFWSTRFPGHNPICASPYPFWSGGFVISSPKCRYIVSHIVWDSFMSPETTIGVVVCDSLWRDVNVKVNVKASYGLSYNAVFGSSKSPSITESASRRSLGSNLQKPRSEPLLVDTNSSESNRLLIRCGIPHTGLTCPPKTGPGKTLDLHERHGTKPSGGRLRR